MYRLISKIPHSIWSKPMLKKITEIPSLQERTTSQALQNFNQYTLELYAQQKAQVKRQLGQTIPVILANQDNLSSRYRGIRKDVTYIPPQYHVLKAIAHIPIAIHTVRQREETQESEKLLEKLEGLFRLCQ